MRVLTAARPIVPASYFGMVLGLAGLGNCWRVAGRLWNLPGWIGEAIMLLAGLVWAVLLLAYLDKWLRARSQVLAELDHPIQCCFVGLVPTSTMLVALGILPYSHDAALALFVIGAVAQAVFGVHRTGTLWTGGRDPADTTPVAYLPTVAGSFVAAIVAGALGHPDWGSLFFGVGLFSWLAYESIVLRRLLEVPSLATALRPTLGIHFAPPVVGCVAYLAITEGVPDLMAQALLGYGIFQGLVLLRLVPWLAAMPFGVSYWAYTFATTSAALSALRFVERGLDGPSVWLAPLLFIVANLVVGGIAAATLLLLVRGKLLPIPGAAPSSPPVA